MATDKIVAEYTVKVDLALKNLDALAGRVSKIDQERKKTEEGFKQMSSNLVSDLSKVGAAMGIAFGVQQLVSFTKETVNLAAQAEGVERAFKRIGGGQYLQGLRDATRGTVTDLVLMQNAVKANNFKIPLENLASLFKFAQARARETGESVDYLVDSIILGIGRKSPLILDNLGISAVELRSRLKGVGVEAANVGDIAKIIGDIATEEMAKMGDQADTTADKIAQIGTSFENMKVDIGKSLILLVEDVSKAWDVLVDVNAVRAKEASDALTESFKEGQSNAQKTIKNIEGIMKEDEGRMKMIQQNLTFIEDAYDAEQKKVKDLQTALDLANMEYGFAAIKKQKQLKAEIQASDELSESYLAQIDVFQSYINVATAKADTVENEIKNVAYYQAAIKDVVDAIQAEGTAVKDIMPLREKEKQLRAELAKLLGEETKEQKELREQLEKIAKLRMMEYTLMQSTGIPVTQAMSSTVAGLNKLLSEQRKILETSPEFSQQYKDASIAVDELEKKLKNFSDKQIDPSEGFPNISAMGVGAPTNTSGKPWFDGLTDAELAYQDESLRQWNEYVSQVSSLMNGLSNLSTALTNMELANLEEQLNKGQITREKYDEKRRAILTKQAEDEKAFNIFNAIINGASAVVSAFRDGGPVLAAIVAAAVAAEVAVIAATPTPQFAKGVIDLQGKGTGTSDSIDAKLSKGESVMTAEETKKHKAMFKAIRSGGWDKYKMENIITPAIEQVLEGGFEGMGASYILNNNFNDKNLLKAFDRNRTSEKDSARFIVQELRQVLKPRKRGGYA